MPATRPFLLDTDIGTDVDDLLTLAMLPGIVDADLVAVTTVYGDTDLRARIAAVACDQLGLRPRIAAGQREPLSGRQVFWAGHEGDGIDGLSGADYDHGAGGVGVQLETSRSYRGHLEVVAIGPLTNLATAILADPDFAGRIRHLYLMGGDFRAEPTRPEHNFRSDALATWIVLHAGIPTTICGYEITTQVLLTAPDIDRIERGSPAGPLLADQTRRFWTWLATWASPEHQHANSPHDPMALLTAFRPELFRFEAVRIDVTASDDAGAAGVAGAVRATADPASPLRVVRDAQFAEVKEAVVGGLVTAAR